MLHRSHLASVTEVGIKFRGTCSCGWMSRQAYSKIQEAADAAVQHSKAKGCGKHRFTSQEDADEAVLRAKIAHAVRGNSRRHENRSYFCGFCTAYHLTSQPLRHEATG